LILTILASFSWDETRTDEADIEFTFVMLFAFMFTSEIAPLYGTKLLHAYVVQAVAVGTTVFVGTGVFVGRGVAVEMLIIDSGIFV
jgi:hypothetical protein